LSLQGVASPSLLSHGGVRLDPVQGHIRALMKPCDSGVYDGSGARDLLHAQGSRIPSTGRGIRRGKHGVLRVGVWCIITLISSLFAVVVWIGTASLDPLRDFTHCDHCDPV
jgi:hypothetical protein